MIRQSGTRFADQIMRKDAVFLANRAAPDIRGARVFGRNRTRVSRFAAIAQLVEHVIRNDGVGGSSPSCGTNLQIRSVSSLPK